MRPIARSHCKSISIDGVCYTHYKYMYIARARHCAPNSLNCPTKWKIDFQQTPTNVNYCDLQSATAIFKASGFDFMKCVIC